MEQQISPSLKLSPEKFRKQFRILILLTWNLPPVVGLSFILFTGVLTADQMAGILLTPIEPAYILAWIVFTMWYFPRYVRPISKYLETKDTDEQAVYAVLNCIRGFPLHFWTLFLIYLVIAPASVILAAEVYTDYVAQPLDWFRIELIALIVSIIVGLPIFFLVLDLFGKAIGGIQLKRPYVSLKVKVFLIGALVPLLIDTMLVQYYWTRTGFFNIETFFVWLVLELLAIGGSLVFVRSIGQSLQPLQKLFAHTEDISSLDLSGLTPQSTDELGVLASDYRQLLEQLRSSRQRLQVHMQRTPLGAIEWNTDFEVVEWNPAAEKMFGFSRNEALGRPAVGLIVPETARELVSEIWQGLLQQKGGTHSINENITKRGKAILCEWYNTPLIDDHGKVIGVASLVDDITDRVRAENELRRHRDHLEEMVDERTAHLKAVNKELEAFSYAVSHDLRAPLRAIDGFSKAFLEDFGEGINQEGRKYLDRVCAGVERMSDLIDDLLQLSRVTRSDFSRSDIDLSVQAREIVRKLEQSDPQRKMNIKIADDLVTSGDDRLVYIALENLIGNAWKYTRHTDNPEIVFDKIKQDDEDVFFIRDNGAGFDMQFAGKLFGAFQRLHNVDEFEGTGIGLATVQRIVNRHGGRVWAEASPDHGATFYFTLG